MNLIFLNSAFLVATSAAVLPLVIHLISRRRVETVDFSSIRFLKELERKKIRRVRLRQILLLVVRTLLILAVALAAARPTLSGPMTRGAGRARTSAAIVLDTSASMSRRGHNGDLFEEARAAALGIAGLLGEGDQAFLITATTSPSHVIDGGTFSGPALRAAIDGLEAGFRGTDYSGALRLAVAALDGSRNLNREIYLIGDQQATGWAGGPVADAAIPGTTAAEGAPQIYVLELNGPIGNVGLTSASPARRYGGAEGLHSVTAGVANHSRVSTEAQLRLFVDGVQAGQTGVGLGPGAEGSASFAVALDGERWHAGWVELPSDALAADDRRYFAVAPARRSEVLIVEPDDETPSGEGYYLARALDPAGEADRFRVSAVAASRLEDQEQGRFAALILADAGRLTEAASAWLERHVSSGGGLLVVLGGRTDVRWWNEGHVPRGESVRIRELVDAPHGARLVPSLHGHGLLEGLVFGERLVDEIPVRKLFAVDVDDAEEILEVPGTGPALLFVRSPGGGEVALLLTGIDPSWNGLSKSGFLIPLAHRLTERLAGVDRGSGSVLVGEELSVAVPPESPGPVLVTTPDGSTGVPALLGRGRASIAPQQTNAPGVYSFTRGGVVVALGAVNVAPGESDLTPASRADIASRLGGLPSLFAGPGGELERRVLEARHGRELWRVFVYVALGLLGVEMYLARPRAA